MKKILILCVIAINCFNGWSQNSINEYKYVVVPLQYEFLKGQNVHRLNTLTKVLFKEEGFDVYFEKSELPEDLFKDRCLAMYVDVQKVKGGFRKTKLEITLKNCRGELVMKSDVGQSGDNNHEKRHQAALRDAFNSIKKLNYNFQPKSSKPAKVEQTNEVKAVKKIEKVEAVEEVVKIEKVESKKASLNNEKVEIIEAVAEKEKPSSKKISNALYAVSINNGYQIQDDEKKSVMVLLNTAAKNVFIVKGKDAIVFKENDKWMYSENDGTSYITKELNIKF